MTDPPTLPALDPDAAALHRALLALDLPPVEALAPARARTLMAELRRAAPAPALPLPEVVDLQADGPAGPVALRLYRPAAGVLPVVVYYHGGGWVLGDLDSHDELCRRLALASGAAVLAVNYRLAPEHPFPAAVEDAAAALHWIARDGAARGLDPARVAVMGDSAGGNLAAVMAILARDGAVPPVTVQILIYPATDLPRPPPPVPLQIPGLLLNHSSLDWFWDHYLAGQAGDWRAAPLLAERLAGVAPCVIVTAGIDPLCPEGLAYASRLAGSGVALELRHYPGQIHGFLTAAPALTTAARELRLCGARLAEALGLPAPAGAQFS